ncbi:MAG: bifunctional oligoribonuclease/PAP phosphatase NrnA, partial [Clostridia bacterium]|nr:bifunctional oligoribonuclease/PAP phosphatase NrnA [Clostridia bacterium]
ALFIVLDTGTLDRVSQKRISDATFIIKIDHHIDNLPYGDLSWVEEERSSTCEMIASFCLSFPDVFTMNKAAAAFLFVGMVTDTGRFRFEGTVGDTMRIAGALLDQGIDRERIFANLYMESFESLQFSAQMTKRIRITEHGVAYLHITENMIRKYGITTEQASSCISLMEKIRGSCIYLAFVDYPDGSIRVRLRSRFVPVQKLASKYRGGGHANASGATVYSRSEMRSLLAEADELLKLAKENGEDLL